jgi:hypothetical protein
MSDCGTILITCCEALTPVSSGPTYRELPTVPEQLINVQPRSTKRSSSAAVRLSERRGAARKGSDSMMSELERNLTPRFGSRT